MSIASNIAEGKERETAPEFVRYLYMAKGSAGELKTQLIIAEEIGYLAQHQAKELKARVIAVSGMIGALLRTLKGKRREISLPWASQVFSIHLSLLSLFSLVSQRT